VATGTTPTSAWLMTPILRMPGWQPRQPDRRAASHAHNFEIGSIDSLEPVLADDTVEGGDPADRRPFPLAPECHGLTSTEHRASDTQPILVPVTPPHRPGSPSAQEAPTPPGWFVTAAWPQPVVVDHPPASIRLNGKARGNVTRLGHFTHQHPRSTVRAAPTAANYLPAADDTRPSAATSNVVAPLLYTGRVTPLLNHG
jgi:hypothetical protein